MRVFNDLISENRVVIKTVLLFFFVVVVLHLFFYELFMFKDSSREFTAGIVSFLLNLFGISASVAGANISIRNFELEVVYECVGVWAMIIYASFVIAYPTNYKNKVIGVALGVPVLFIVAVFRIFLLGVVGVKYPDLFEYFHVYFWQISLIIFIILLLLIWVEKIVKPENE